MQIVYHLGVHCTDNGQIFRTLARSRGIIEPDGIMLPHPDHFRPVIQSTLRSLAGAPAPAHVQEMVLDAIIAHDHPKRIVFSYPSFIGSPKLAIGENRFYPVATERTTRLRALFPQSEVQFFIGLCNPATFLPAIFARLGAEDFGAFLAQTDIEMLMWSELVERLQRAHPDCRLVVWANEDTPLIWPELIRSIAGVGPDYPLRGLHKFLFSLLSREGRLRLKAYMAAHPPDSIAKRRRVEAAFLERFALAEAVEEEIDHPAWTPERVALLTERYEEDLYRIERMEGVELMLP